MQPTSAAYDARDLIQRAWDYPLLDAIFQRRARRIPWGAEKPDGVTPYQSARPALPLVEVEEALLVTTGAGISGTALADLPYTDWDGNNVAGNLLIQFVGRTYPSPCASHGTELFFTNDTGAFFINARGLQPGAVQEYAHREDRAAALDFFRKSAVRLSDRRLPLAQSAQAPWNRWHVNVPGTTMFMPVSDVTWQYINTLMVAMEGLGTYLYDDLNGYAEPLKRFADDGRLRRQRPLALGDFERRVALQVVGIEQSTMLQNMALTAQAMGLGGFVFPALDAAVAFGPMTETGGLGFRHVTPMARSGRPGWLPPLRQVPVGLDGLFQTYCPPYFRDMRDAVRAVYDAKFGPAGIYTDGGGPSALKDRHSLSTEVPRTPDWVVDATADFCQYLWETYGRVPVTVDPMATLLWFQALHLDTEFYDRYYLPGAYTDAIAEHIKVWHPDVLRSGVPATRAVVERIGPSSSETPAAARASRPDAPS